MSYRPDGGPAFPRDELREGQVYDQYAGMTLRDYFAAQAIQGLQVRRWEDPATGEVPNDIFKLWAEAAYRTADAMLAARNA